MECAENLLLGLDGSTDPYELFERCQNGEWHPTFGDLLILAVYLTEYERKLEDFLDRLDLNGSTDGMFYEDALNPKLSRTNGEKLAEIRTAVEEMKQRRRDNRIIRFIEGVSD